MTYFINHIYTYLKIITYTGRSAQCFVTTSRGGIGRVGGRRKKEEMWGYMYMYS